MLLSSLAVTLMMSRSGIGKQAFLRSVVVAFGSAEVSDIEKNPGRIQTSLVLNIGDPYSTASKKLQHVCGSRSRIQYCELLTVLFEQ
jgi:hypothetical protein